MWKNRYVRTILLSRVLLQLGIWIRNFAILLYVTEWTNDDPVSVSLISVAEFAPIFLFALIGGTLADRWRPKRTMVWTDVLSMLSVMAVLIALRDGGWIPLLVGSFVSASLSQLSQPSAMKLYKRHVPEEQLQAVMAMSQSMVAFFTVLGPVVGAFVYMRFGIDASLVATAVLFFGSAVVLTMLPRDEMRDVAGAGWAGAGGGGGAAQVSFWEEMKAGMRYIAGNRALRTLSSTFAAAGLAAGLIQPLLIFIVMEKLGMDKPFVQWVLMVNGAAMLVGGGLIMGIAKKVRPQHLLAIGLLVSAGCTVAVGASSWIWLSLTLQVISGLFYPCIQVGIQTLLFRNTEGAYIGRVSGAITPIFMGMMVLGMLAGGFLKDWLTLFPVYVMSGALLVIGALLLLPLLAEKPAARRELGA
ncbi:MFS transporter [Paenibacillus koleovorans]|uniref:MFS transporter n=1 Tax=Paenibacillus koleovorans TaxID=121608 RepID=UPI000FDBBAAD|nr:MFS transporter [Paenibacillus koleovorans]